MRFTGKPFIRTAVLVCLSIAGCSGSGSQSPSSGSAAATSGGNAASSNSSGGTTTQGPGTSTGAGPSSGTGTGGGGTTTGGSGTGTPPSFVDGGYVSCSMSSAPDAGPYGDGGPAHWNCQPGTYVCDLGGNIGNCFQCQSDQDCANPRLPTYDPKHLHCDLNTGVAGYQNFCQECVADSDCKGNPAGKYCDLNPTFPAGASQPPIVNLGFEHCSKLLTDCRIDGGPGCAGTNNEFCDPTNGVCVNNPGTCTNDNDCAGLVSPYNTNLPEPFCVKGNCNSCAGGICPNAFCSTDADCGNPKSSPTGLLCDLATYQCSCTDSSQCSGFWPACENLDGKRVNDAGQILGTCGCDDTDQCGDGGLICLPPNPLNPSATTSCGIPCTSPEFQACGTAAPVCNPVSGTCGSCTDDTQCRNGAETGGNVCDRPSGGMGHCGCVLPTDCPIGEACGPGPYFLDICTASLPRCTPDSCGSYFCDWDAGTCLSNIDMSLPGCITDYDCAAVYSTGALCDKGRCIQCRGNADCLANGYAATGGSVCCLSGNPLCASYATNTCADVCGDDQDCAGNVFGPSCDAADGGQPARCGCGTDVDCKGYLYGQHCDRDPSDPTFGTCICRSDSDCAPGASCPIYTGTTYGFCSSYCYPGDAGFDCPASYFCDPSYTCRPRCDDGNACQGPNNTCDSQNAGGQNGKTVDGTSPGVTWCYRCTQPSACGAGQGCNPLTGCGTCATTSECPSGTACIDGGVCQPTCQGGNCPQGEVCDTYGLAGYGPNVCYQCISPADCPDGEGCDDQSHTCGTCFGPTASGGPFDCPPDAICSNYWSPTRSYTPGVCLANCDRESCPASEPICAVYPGLTPDHKFCFGCLQDSDCADAGPGARCNLSPNTTFTCVKGT